MSVRMPQYSLAENREGWSVLNGKQQTVFQGSWRECEDWLDHQENLTRSVSRSSSPSVISRIWTRLATLWNKTPKTESGDAVPVPHIHR